MEEQNHQSPLHGPIEDEEEDEEEYLGAGDPSFWYGYDIWYRPNTTPEPDRPYSATIFRKHQISEGYEDVGGFRWAVSTQYQAWFPTLEEARSAAEAFCDDMHWKREAEWLGVGQELAEQLSDEVNKVAEELRRLYNQDREALEELTRKIWAQNELREK
jgi:hypothetical protein